MRRIQSCREPKKTAPHGGRSKRRRVPTWAAWLRRLFAAQRVTVLELLASSRAVDHRLLFELLADPRWQHLDAVTLGRFRERIVLRDYLSAVTALADGATCWAMASLLESPSGLPEDLVVVPADMRPPPPSVGAAPPGRAKPQVAPVTPSGG